MSRTLGIDLGSKRIGIAVSDETGLIAQAHTVLERKGKKEDINRLRSIIESLSVDTLIVGLPRNMDGSYGPQAENARKFASQVFQETGVRTVLHDERMTTTMATRTLIEGDMSRARRREVVDKVAAQIILQSYLDCAREIDRRSSTEDTKLQSEV